MAKERAYRKFMLTINNPLERQFSHEILRGLFKSFENCLYWCMGDEIGEQGTPHTHIYLLFRNAVMFSTIQRRFYGAHIEPAKGSSKENRDYIRKEGKWLTDKKHETSLPDTFEESGELPDERTPHKKDSEAILEMIELGASNAEILRAFPTSLSKLHHIDHVRQTLLEEKYKTIFRQLYVEYLWGETGIGKTRKIMEKYGYENVFRVTNYQHPFDGYNGQNVILFDEFRSSLPIVDMLKYLDGYPVMLPCRFNDRAACFTEVYVVSNIPFDKQYPDIQVYEPETWKAFKRRFNTICKLVPDEPDWILLELSTEDKLC